MIHYSSGTSTVNEKHADDASLTYSDRLWLSISPPPPFHVGNVNVAVEGRIMLVSKFPLIPWTEGDGPS